MFKVPLVNEGLCFCVEWLELSCRGQAEAGTRCAVTLASIRKIKDPHILHCHECGATAEFALRGSKEGGDVKYFCARHLNSICCFRVDRDRAAWAQNRVEHWRLKAEVARLEEELRQMGGASPAAEQTEESTWNESWQVAVHWDLTPESSSLIAKLLMIGGVEKNPGPAHVPDAAVSKDKGDPADKGETMPGRDASSGGPLIAVPPWEEVYNTSARSSKVQRVSLFEQWRTERRLSEQISIANEGGQGADGAAGAERAERAEAAEGAEGAEGADNLFAADESVQDAIGTTNRTSEQSDLPHKLEEQIGSPFASATSLDLDHSGMSEDVPFGQPLSEIESGPATGLEAAEKLQGAPASLAGSGVAGESGRVVGLKRSSVWRSPRVSANSRARGSTAEDPSLAASGLLRLDGSNETLGAVVASTEAADQTPMLDDPSSNTESLPAAPMDPDDASVSIGDTSDESESEEEPTSEDDRGIDDSLQPSADDVNLCRAMEQEQQQARDAPESLDAAFAGMRMEAEQRRQREEGADGGSTMVLSQDLIAVPEPAVHSDTLSGNEVFRKDEFRVMRVHSYGTNCFHQTGKNPRGRFPGPKFFMQQEAALLNHGVQVALHKWSGKRTPAGVPIGWRSFASYPDWETAQRHLRAAHHGSVNEIIQHGKPCKPYLDLDGKDGLPFRPDMGQTDVAGAETEGQQRNPEVPGGVSGESGAEVGAQPGGEGAGERYTVAEVIAIVEEWSEIVFGECFNVQLKRPSSFVWMESGGQSKFSLHLTINHLHPRQLIFGANSEGALHFATRLKKRLQPWHPRVASLIDLNVYTKDREWRTPGSAKIEKPESVLTFVNPAHTWKDALVTWLEPPEAHEEIKLPFQLPSRLHERFKNPRIMSERGTERSSGNDDFVKARMLVLLKERLHPTAYEEGPDRFNYTDRSEPCYTGRVHENHQNLTCHLNPNGKIYALCFSTNVEGGDSEAPCVSTAFCLGELFEDNITYESGAVSVDMQYLQRDFEASNRELLAAVAQGERVATDALKLNTVLNEWLAGDFPRLSLRSGVNTGKTECCKNVVKEIRQTSAPQVVNELYITYRVAQAKDLKKRFPETANYLDLKADYKDEWFPDPNCRTNLLTALQNRDKFPQIVVQVDSLLNLRPHGIGEVAPFDLVILDEVASILAHLSSATLRSGLQTGELFCEIVKNAKRVLAMDDGYGQREHEFFQLAGVPGKLVINWRRAAVPLTFRVCQEEARWLDRIVADLSANRNVVVVSMSARVLDRIRDRVTSHEAGLGLADDDILVHSAMSGGENAALFENVSVNWRVRLLMYSPSVEAGVNFDEDWFYSKYLYMCKKSTTARAVWQASLRVRRTESALVYCFVQQGISIRLDCAQEIPADHLQRTSSLPPGPDDEAGEGGTSEVRLDQQVAVESPLEASQDLSPPAETGSADQQIPSKKTKPKARPPGFFVPPRRVTTAETLQFLQACNAQVAVAWRRVLSRSENGPAAVRLVEDGPLFRTLAHTEAERRNSDARLLHEFQLQVAKAGHVVEVEPYEEPAEKRKRKGPGLSAEAYSVLEARLLGYEEYQILKESRDVKRDRGTESVEVNKYEACAFYGLKELSESFLLQKVVDYKTPFSEPLLFLLKVLLHGRFLDPEAVGRKGQEIVRVEIAQELIKDLGFKHAFDRSFTPSLLKGGLMKKLMESRLFKGRQVYSGGKASLAEQSPAQMFQIELPKPEPGCDHLLPGQIKKVVDAVLRQMGLRLDGTVEVSRGARRGKGKNYESSSGKNDYKYRLHEKSIQRMAKLVKLQFREVPRVWRCRMDLLPAVRDFLDEVDASEFDNLLRRPSGLPMLAHLGPPEVDGEIDFGSRCMIVPRPRNDRSA